MKIIKSVLFGALIAFSATLLHNYLPPFGFVASLLLTYLGIRVVGQNLYYLRYQVLAGATWLAVVIRAGTPGDGDELLIYGNTYGNLFLISGFAVVAFSLVLSRSNSR